MQQSGGTAVVPCRNRYQVSSVASDLRQFRFLFEHATLECKHFIRVTRAKGSFTCRVEAILVFSGMSACGNHINMGNEFG
jgi:hypothetical protein